MSKLKNKIEAKRGLLALTVITASLMTTVASAGVVDLSWDAKGMFAHEAEIKAGGALEVCGKLPKNLSFDWHFKSTQALEMNIHFHEGEKLSVPVERPAALALNERFQTKLSKDYCWMWTNRTAQVAQIQIGITKIKPKR